MSNTSNTFTNGVPPPGSFVHTALGVGRLVEIEDGQAHVRYFRSPGRAPYEDRRLVVGGFADGTLSSHTRVYQHDGRRWRIGRVDGRHPQHPEQYLIAFPNGEGAVLPVEAFEVRWNEPICDPYEILESVGGDSPQVYESRLGVLAEWGRQRAAARGVEGLLLASVELHRHQMQVVRRVATDPVKRYLLADEVGLGKTIEAGAVICQYLAERPTSRVLILAPEHLREQWGTELLDTFRVDPHGQAWVRIRSHENDASWPRDPVDLLVIDEAHHFTRNGDLSAEALAAAVDLAHRTDALLLLSATPVRSNEAGFLDLLHLIDPANYRPDHLDAFLRRVELRDQLALTYQALAPTLDEFDLSLYAEELRAQFTEDATLDDLLTVALSADEADRPAAILGVREHLSETYRLHHRLLRTRRSPQIGSTFSVRGRKRAVPFTLEIADPSDVLRRELLDSLRAELTAAVEEGRCALEDACRLLRDVAGRCSSSSHALLPLLSESPEPSDDLIGLQELAYPAVREAWDALVEDIHASHRQVLEDVGEVISRTFVARGVGRLVLCSAYSATAVAVAKQLSRRWGSHRVTTHLRDQSDTTNSAALVRWRENGPCTILVCDAGAEEGLNLQDAEILVHLDLPWDSFRIEQRIGRCDRHGRTGMGPIPSAVVVLGDQPYAVGWFEFLADGCHIFTESVSSLQYVLSDTERDVQARVLHAGPSALSDAVEDQAQHLAKERTRIVAHDALDAIDEGGGSPGDEADAELIATDRARRLTGSTMDWLTGVGARVLRPTPGTLRISRRPRPQIPFDLEVALAPFFETDIALERDAAVERAIPILRAGHPFVDVLAAHLQTTDRGVAFAMFRPAGGQWPAAVAFRTDFLVTIDTGQDIEARARNAGIADWLAQSVAALAPPRIETVYTTADGVSLEHPALRQPYNKQAGDRNLSSRPQLFDRLTEHIDWPIACSEALRHAEAALESRSRVFQLGETVGASLAGHIRQFADRERSRAFAGLDRDERRWHEFGTVAAEDVRVRADVVGCGVILLADPRHLERHA